MDELVDEFLANADAHAQEPKKLKTQAQTTEMKSYFRNPRTLSKQEDQWMAMLFTNYIKDEVVG